MEPGSDFPIVRGASSREIGARHPLFSKKRGRPKAPLNCLPQLLCLVSERRDTIKTTAGLRKFLQRPLAGISEIDGMVTPSTVRRFAMSARACGSPATLETATAYTPFTGPRSSAG